MIEKELAELCGIVAGDGHIVYNKKHGDYKVEISGDYKELEYFNYIKNLFLSLFNKEPKIITKKDGLFLYISSKKIVEKLISLDIPAGKKKDKIRMPKWAMSNKNLGYCFLKGLADTDFSVCFKKGGRLKHSYPVIKVGFCSKRLVEDIKIFLDSLGISYCYWYRNKKTSFGVFDLYELDINGKENLEKWMKFIGFSNKKHLNKIKFWKENGYYYKGLKE